MPDEPLIVSVTDGARTLRAVIVREGEDLVVSVSGGDRPHVGCAVMAVPHRFRKGDGYSATVSVLCLSPHKEERIARPVAETLARSTGAVTVVVAGVHEDDADSLAIAAWIELADQLPPAILRRLDRDYS